MSCYGCVTKFSLFTKEHSCGKCNLSFCNKCLKHKVTIGTEETNVCYSCYKMLNSPSTAMPIPEIDALQRLETLENPAKPPITIFRQSNRLNNLKCGLSSEDKKILERLEKLKADRAVSNLPDENEIKRRLALLQDKSVESIGEKSQKLVSTSKSQQEEVDDLLKQYIDETGITSSIETVQKKNVGDIEARLKNLQMSEGAPEPMDSSNQEDENEDEVLKIVKRAISEGRLERRLEESMGKDEDSEISDMDESENETEFPWCIICNENATVRCFGCDRSLYCNTCFKQGHEFFNMEDHKFVPFEAKDSSP